MSVQALTLGAIPRDLASGLRLITDVDDVLGEVESEVEEVEDARLDEVLNAEFVLEVVLVPLVNVLDEVVLEDNNWPTVLVGSIEGWEMFDLLEVVPKPPRLVALPKPKLPVLEVVTVGREVVCVVVGIDVDVCLRATFSTIYIH